MPKRTPKQDFPDQHADEQLILVFRRHIIAMRKGFIGLLVPFGLSCIPFLIWQNNTALLWLPVIGFGVGLLIFFYHWVIWYFSIYIITSERIRQSSQNGLFGRSVINLSLSKVQSLSYNIPGFIGELFGFGTIVLQTMVGDMIIHKVAHCKEVFAALSDAVRLAEVASPDDEAATPDIADDTDDDVDEDERSFIEEVEFDDEEKA